MLGDNFVWGGLHNVSPLVLVVFVGLIAVAVTKKLFDFFTSTSDPFGGLKPWEPKWFAGMRFWLGARDMIHDGYEKYKGKYFQLPRNDRNILVIPREYVDELRNYPTERLSSIQALINNMVGQYSYMDVLLESNLHTRVLQSKLTPNLANFTSAMADELNYALAKALPNVTDQWSEVEIYEVLRTIVARVSARIFVGLPTCRNDEWIFSSIRYTEAATITTMLLRGLPAIFRPFVVRALPSYWNTKKWVKRGADIILPIIDQRRVSAEKPGYERPSDLLQWMIDEAKGKESDTYNLALRELVMNLASVHTTTMSTAHVLFDMCQMPEYFNIMRDEMRIVLAEDNGWQRLTPTKLRKLDSMLKESQRVSPPSLLGFHRLVQNQPITLSDGKVLPPGTHVCTASYEISRDEDILPNQEYDGLRYYKLRDDPANDKRLAFAQTDKAHMHFGHGRHACPGRFFASNEMKMILTELLLRYDFKFVDGQGRPTNINADEFLYADPSTKLLVKKRVEE
ncbi:putative cytochrome P450 [Talaromyces proteolyticus]|uniref:Cytochrome P450 n=1 Tax=Talaromyces proteolyticus TaxID=1131652 RepID=A0AAD4Q4P5_9EURO|nr:putative cytochrome P450 [Talaromyces proteolyticus]KAH8703476.1 putative cytochrome P450 [Talaromyces proteolyticus]